MLASPRIRVRNREKAKIMIGSRVPVITNAVTPVSTGTPVITGSVQYLDVGLKLEVEPDIHLDNEVVIKMNLDVSSIIKEVPNTLSGTLAYEVGTRNASTVLRLKDGETQVLAGLINDEDRNSASKVPGLGQIPVLGRLFSSHKDDGMKTEIVLSITPRIVGNSRSPGCTGSRILGRDRGQLCAAARCCCVRWAPSRSAVRAARAPSRQRQPRTAAPAAGRLRQPQPLALSWQGPNQAKVGDKISLTLNTPSSQGVESLGFLVGFDPTVLRAIDVTEGDFLKQSHMPSNLSKTIDQASGQILVDLSGTGSDVANAGGSVATLVFEVIGGCPAVANHGEPYCIIRRRRRSAGIRRARAACAGGGAMSRGFTLIELVITVAIVSLLASVVLPMTELVVQRSKEQELRLALRQIRGALDAYRQAVDEGRVIHSVQQSGYPPSLKVLVDGVPDASSPDRKRKIYFLRRIPRDPMFAGCFQTG